MSRHATSVARSGRDTFRRELGQRARQPARDLVGYRLQLRPARERDHDLRVERLDDGPVADGADDDVAWQQQPDAPVNAEGLMREWRTAGAEDHVILHLLAELFPQGGGEVDLGEHAEPLTGEGLADPGDRLREWHADRDAGAVAHRLAPSCAAILLRISLRISFMSSPLTAWMTFSSEAAGSAPGCENTRMPSRKAIRVGMEVIWAAADSPPWSSVSTLPNVMSGCFSLAAWKTGANIRHGPHQDAHQSISVIPGPVTVSSNVSSVTATVLIFVLRLADGRYTPGGITPFGTRYSRPRQPQPNEKDRRTRPVRPGGFRAADWARTVGDRARHAGTGAAMIWACRLLTIQCVPGSCAGGSLWST